MDYNARREDLYLWLRSCLIGPGADVGSESDLGDLHGIKPLERYQTGILFPIVKGEDGLDPAAGEIEDGEDAADFQGDQEEPQPTASSGQPIQAALCTAVLGGHLVLRRRGR